MRGLPEHPMPSYAFPAPPPTVQPTALPECDRVAERLVGKRDPVAPSRPAVLAPFEIGRGRHQAVVGEQRPEGRLVLQRFGAGVDDRVAVPAKEPLNKSPWGIPG